MPTPLARSSLQRRLTNLEAVLTDDSRFVPHTLRWLEYWDRQFFLYTTGQDSSALRHSSVDAFRAVMKYAEENPASLVGSIPPYQEDGAPRTPAQSNELADSAAGIPAKTSSPPSLSRRLRQ